MTGLTEVSRMRAHALARSIGIGDELSYTSELLRYVMRLRPEVRDQIAQYKAKVNYPSPLARTVSVHIRHGDKAKEAQSNFYDVPCYVKVCPWHVMPFTQQSELLT